MFIFVLPKLTSTFTDLSVELPILTRVLVAVVGIFSFWIMIDNQCLSKEFKGEGVLIKAFFLLTAK